MKMLKKILAQLLVALVVVATIGNANAQFANGQVLTAPALNAAIAAPTITGGTINGAPIGASSPNTGAFTTLSTTGAATLNSLSVTGAPIPFSSGGTNATTATGATSQLQYLQGAPGSVARPLTSKFQDVVNVNDFSGADPTGVADSTGAAQAAITAVCNAGGGRVNFGAGNYKISSVAITCSGLQIAGSGVQATTITATTTTGNVFAFSSPANAGIRDLYINYSGVPTSGAAISISNVRNFTADKIKVQGAFQGLNISGGVIQYYTNLEIINTVATNGVGIYITGFGNDQFLKNIVMDAPNAAQPLAGIRVNNTNAVWIDAVDTIHQGIGLLVDPQAATDFISWLFVSNSAFDTGSGDGIRLAPANAASVIKGSTFVNSWTSTNAGLGVSITGAGIVDGARFVAHRSFNNGKSGYLIDTTGGANKLNIAFNDSDAAGNSQSASGTYSGFDIGAAVSGFSITNCRSGQQAQFANTQSRGIIVNPGASTNYTLMGNDVRGNISNAIYDGGTGANKIIKGNLGYNPIASTAITVGASPFTYTNNTGDTVNVFVTGGTVSSVTLGGNQIAAASNTVVPVPQGASVVVTYTVAPTMTYTGN